MTLDMIPVLLFNNLFDVLFIIDNGKIYFNGISSDKISLYLIIGVLGFPKDKSEIETQTFWYIFIFIIPVYFILFCFNRI